MAPKAAADAKAKGGKAEVLQFKSPAEFFAENQNIAGFDNPGKALYTSIREFVENSLDAAESAGRLPDVTVLIEEMDSLTFRRVYKMDATQRVDLGLYGGKGAKGDDDAAVGGDEDSELEADAGAKRKRAGGNSGTAGDAMYYRITCRDNGCGMPHDKIPDFLGRVLSGSKYGVRQTRGKFGLGSKMCLIWAKKSTGIPITITTAHGTGGGSTETNSAGPRPVGTSTASVRPPSKVSYCKLDIDIHKNVPHVLEHVSRDNVDGWIGTEISVTISGAWSSYRYRVVQYFTQIAIITPYAAFKLDFRSLTLGPLGESVSASVAPFPLEWKRRSTQIPRPPKEVKHHPSAVNDLLIRQLMEAYSARSSSSSSGSTLVGFLTHQFASIDRKLALRLCEELGHGPDTSVDSLDTKRVHAITRLLCEASFAPPSGDCLSPAGEYNLRLGIMKELRPDLLATCSAPVAVFEGHPFIVEAGVALGGHGPDGLTVHRFANRIPLLFEGGADVATRTAVTRIKWADYKIDFNRDKVGVFVSLVSTRIPFKGTGKEYVGDDLVEIRDAVQGALKSCCVQLRVKLLRAQAARARANRRKILLKYVPDVVRALVKFRESMAARELEDDEDDEEEDGGAGVGAGRGSKGAQSKKRKLGPSVQVLSSTVAEFRSDKVTSEVLASALENAVEKADMDAALEAASAASAGLEGTDAGTGGGLDVFLAPTGLAAYARAKDLHHSACVIRFLPASMGGPMGGPL